MPRIVRAALAPIALGAMLLLGFGRLAAEPSALLVDPDRPAVDHAVRGVPPTPGNDLTRLFLPHHLAISGQWARLGRVPAWDDRGFGGRPMVGNPQGGLFYPPAWVAWWSGAPSALGWITAGHLLWAGLGTYRLGRTLGLGEWGRLVAAGCFQLSPYVLAQVGAGHDPHVWAASWYPWAFDAALRLRRGESRAGLALPPILAASALAGHPQEAYYLLVAVGFWVVLDGLARARSGDLLSMGRLWAAWGLVLALMVGLIGVELVPDAMAQPWGLRTARFTLRMASSYHPGAVNALQMIGPRALGGPGDYIGPDNSWETLLSVGLVPMVLALAGIRWAWGRPAVRGWSALAGLALAFALGRYGGLFVVLFHLVPGMDRFRVPSRSLFLASLALAVLAGFGVDALRSRRDRPGWLALIASALLAAAVLVGHRLSRNCDHVWLCGLSRIAVDPVFWLALIGATLATAWARWRPSHRRSAATALGLLGLVELVLYAHASVVTSLPARFLGPDPIGLALERARPAGPAPPRIRAVDWLYDDLRAVRIGFAKTNIHDAFQLQHAADLYERLYRLFDPDPTDLGRPMDGPAADRRRQVQQAVLDRLGVTLLVSDHPEPEGPWLLVESGTHDGHPFTLFRNPTALPPAYVVPEVAIEPDRSTVVDRFPEVDPRRAVLMPFDPLATIPGPRQPFTPAEWASTDPDRVVLCVSTEWPGLLVVADTWMPGWTATVDGRLAPVLRGNRAQRVVPLPEPGRHEVILSYHPPGLSAGLALTAASATVWALLAASVAIRRPSHIGPPGEQDRA